MNFEEQTSLIHSYEAKTDAFIELLCFQFENDAYLSALMLVCDPFIIASFYDRYCEIQDYLRESPKEEPQYTHDGAVIRYLRSIFINYYNEIADRRPRSRLFLFRPRQP